MGKKILIIDDDTDVLDIMKEIFNYEGFAVLTSPVADGYESIIRRNDIDLVIIDYLLQGVNGGEICNQIKCSNEFWPFAGDHLFSLSKRFTNARQVQVRCVHCQTIRPCRHCHASHPVALPSSKLPVNQSTANQYIIKATIITADI